MPAQTVQDALDAYLKEIADSRSPNTHRTYRNAIEAFSETLRKHEAPPNATPAADIAPDWLTWFIQSLRPYAEATERLYLTAIVGFYEYVAAEEIAPVNLPRVRGLVKRRGRKVAQRLPPFPRDEIEQVLDYVNSEAVRPIGDEREALRNLRDRALLFTLADTGLRISEACRLTRGHLNWAEGYAGLTIKGGREEIVRFSERALAKVKAYLEARAPLDGATGRPLASLPLFARHDDGAGDKVKPLNTVGARNAVDRWVAAALGPEARGTITPHSFRHYFVTVVLRASGGNLRLAQELARHKNIAITQRYAHISDEELDRGYHEIFNTQAAASETHRTDRRSVSRTFAPAPCRCSTAQTARSPAPAEPATASDCARS